MSQLPIALPHRPAFGRADFLVSAANEAAVRWLDRWPDWPAAALLLHGPPGCGKSHLARLWCARAGGTFIPGEGLDGDALAGLLEQGPRQIAIDDAQRAGERALLHLYNAVHERGGTLLLAAGRAPGAWEVGLPDLRSRLRAMLAVGIGAPDDALLGAVLVKHFADRQLRVAPEVIAYLVARIERSFAAAAEIAARLDALALAEKRPITVPLARSALAQAQSPGAADQGVA